MKLIYFDVKGLAEVSRYILAVAGCTYEDYRYPLEVIDPVAHKYNREKFDEDKKNGRFKHSMEKVPILQLDDGTEYCQSKAIERYLATKFDLMGSTPEEHLKIDSICECIRDFKDEYIRMKHSSKCDNEDLVRYFEETLPENFLKLSRMMTTKSSNKKFSVGDKLSLADIVIYAFVNDFFTDTVSSKKASSRSVHIRGILENVSENEGIKEWISKRPHSTF